MNVKIWTLLQGENLVVFPEDNCKLIGVFTEHKKAITAARFVIALHTNTNFDEKSGINVADWIDAQVDEIKETGRTQEGSIAFMLKESFTDVIDVDALDI